MFGLSKKIREFNDLRRVALDIPEWSSVIGDDKIYMREMDGPSLIEWARATHGIETITPALVIQSIPKTILRCVVSENWKRVFEDSDAEWIFEKSAQALAALAAAFMDVNYLSQSSQEELEKNSRETIAV